MVNEGTVFSIIHLGRESGIFPYALTRWSLKPQNHSLLQQRTRCALPSLIALDAVGSMEILAEAINPANS